MFHKSISQFILPAVAAVALFAAAPAQAESFTKDQINTMIHDYIKENPQVILDAVQEYQTRETSQKQEAALKQNHDEIFNNEKSPFIGNKTGDVTIVEFFDYNCHYCKDVFPVLQKLTKDDTGLKVIFKDFPILGPSSEVGAKWALAAQRQDKYFEFHAKMMDHKGVLKNEDIEQMAKDIGLDMAAARSYVDGTDVMMQIERNRTLASQMNFNGTPSFIVADEAFSGVPDAESLKEKIAQKRAALKEKGGDENASKDTDKKDEKKPD